MKLGSCSRCADRFMRDRESPALRRVSRPARRLSAGFLEDIATERLDQTDLLGERDEFVWPDEATNRMAPSDERLDPVDHLGRDPDDRLEEDHELTAAEAPRQFGAQGVSGDDRRVHRRLEHATRGSCRHPWPCTSRRRRCGAVRGAASVPSRAAATPMLAPDHDLLALDRERDS